MKAFKRNIEKKHFISLKDYHFKIIDDYSVF